jgi:hypothetical protein
MTYNTIVVNLFSGPGAGKSIMAAAVFAELKWRGYSAECVQEYAKELTRDNNIAALQDQIGIFAEQRRRIKRCVGKVQVVISDSPLLFSLVYGGRTGQLNDVFNNIVIEENNKFRNLNFRLTRSAPYETEGRSQDYEGALKLDKEIEKMLLDLNEKFFDVITCRSHVNIIVEDIIAYL